MKRVEKNGRFYRWRRGVLVEIPPIWVYKCDSHYANWIKIYKNRRRKKDKRVLKFLLKEEMFDYLGFPMIKTRLR